MVAVLEKEKQPLTAAFPYACSFPILTFRWTFVHLALRTTVARQGPKTLALIAADITVRHKHDKDYIISWNNL
jgi:hypothetical protein